jgi:steroid 5-alpha reductase family enzyme
MPFFAFDPYNLLSAALLAVGIQAVFFLFAATLKTDKVTDLSYSLSFIVLALILLIGNESWAAPQILLCVLITVWGLRLGGYLFLRILRIKRDRRFDGIREKPLRFAVFWIVQAQTVWTVMLPAIVFLSLNSVRQPGIHFWVGGLLWLFGFAFEGVADLQKFRFKNRSENRDRWMQQGLWKYSRHPNYFGEAMCWWGIFIISASGLNGWMWATVAGPAFLTALLLFGSGIPPLEKKADQKYGGDEAYQLYKRRTSIFIPLPPKRNP